MAERVTFTAELQDEVSGPAQRMAASVATANEKVARSSERSGRRVVTSSKTMQVAGVTVIRETEAMEKATRRAHGGVGSSWSRLSGKVKAAGAQVSAAARSAGEDAGSRMGEGLKQRFGVALGGLAAMVGAGALAGAANQAVNTFSQLQDASGAAEVVFGENMSAIIDQAENAGETLGMTQAQVIDAANTFGTYGKAAGLSGKELAGFSTEMTALAGDMASFKGTSPEQAIEAIGAALRGEMEPIRAYGVLMDDASLRAEAMKQGLISTTKEALTPQQKSLAAYSLILAQTTDAQGDFARTSDSAANVQKRLEAATTNLIAQVGGLLEPAFTRGRLAVLGIITPLGEFLSNVARAQQLLGGGALTQDVAAALGLGPGATAVVVAILGPLRAFFATLSSGVTNMDAAVTSSGAVAWMERLAVVINQVRALSIPWGTILGIGALLVGVGVVRQLGGVFAIVGRALGPVLAVVRFLAPALTLLLNPAALVVGALVLLYTQSEAFRGAVQGILPLLMTLGSQVVALVVPLAAQLLPVLSQLAAQVFPMLMGVLTVVAPMLGQLAAAVLTLGVQVLSILLPPLLQLVAAVLPVLVGLFTAVVPIIVQVIAAILPLALVLAGQLVPILAQLIMAILPPVIGLFTALVPVLLSVLSALLPLIPPVMQIIALLIQLAVAVITPLLGIVAALAGVLTNVLGGALNGVRPMVEGFLSGLQDLANWLSGVLGPLIETVAGWFRGLGDVIGDALNKVKGFADNPLVQGVRGALGFSGGGVVGGPVQGFAGGGVLSGYAPGRDTVPAMLSRGEAVLTPELTRAIGPANIRAANWAASRRSGTGGGTAGTGGNPAALLGGGGDTNVAVNITYTGTAESLGGVKAAVKSALAEVEAERGRRNYKGA
nr:MAG TPA_asm: tail tape measure [Caudoviricetes sp.]